VIFAMFSRLREAGVLGMNSRNADYIMRWNPRSNYPIVDNKLLTKELAEKHQIPTPALYYVVEHHDGIEGLVGALGSRREFVVKPARGTGGSGIVLVKDYTAEGFVTQNGQVISRGDFDYHLSEILSGVYSLEGLEDRAIIEALIYPDPAFAAVTFQGVPDVRIVVYRGVPAMAMVRLPTRASDGKANLHRGAIGAGVELRDGTTLTAVHRSQVVTHHPDTGNRVEGIRVPNWDQMLLMAARTQEMTGLGYVGVDLVLDRERGPLLLELNARPGLAIQMANRKGLRGRLERIDRAAPEIFSTPDSRVGWAKENL
jgi:alpha-L-glutamate ligase-like protein